MLDLFWGKKNQTGILLNTQFFKSWALLPHKLSYPPCLHYKWTYLKSTFSGMKN